MLHFFMSVVILSNCVSANSSVLKALTHQVAEHTCNNVITQLLNVNYSLPCYTSEVYTETSEL